MAFSFQVEIENTRYVTLLPAKSNASGALNVTPIRPDQTRALVKIAAVRRSRVDPLHTFDVRDLPVRSQNPLAMQLTGKVVGFTRLRLRLHAEGTPRGEVLVPVSRYVLWPFLLRTLVLLALLCVLALGGFALYRNLDALRGADAGRVRTVASLRDETPEPSDPEPADPAAPRDAADPDVDATAADPVPPAPETETAPGGVVADTGELSIVDETRTWIVYFGPDTAELSPAGRAVIAEAAASLAASASTVRVEGHTAFAGSADGRIALSRLRAEVVAEELVAQGLEMSRIGRVAGFAADRQVSTDVSGQHLDRRAEIIEHRAEE